MYEYLKGKFAGISATQLIVDCNGVGYDVNISLYTFSKLKDLTEGKVYIHLSVKEDAHVLYGFADDDERKMFRQLITVSGIGTNTARVILSSMNPAELQQTILNGNAPVLQKIKGIGNKTAQRIIIDLRDKVGKETISDVTFISTPGNTIKNEALSALLVLGFARPNAEKALDGILKRGGEPKVEQLIKEALAVL